jgi:hypothetical protein
MVPSTLGTVGLQQNVLWLTVHKLCFVDMFLKQLDVKIGRL